MHLQVVVVADLRVGCGSASAVVMVVHVRRHRGLAFAPPSWSCICAAAVVVDLRVRGGRVSAPSWWSAAAVVVSLRVGRVRVSAPPARASARRRIEQRCENWLPLTGSSGH